MKKIRYLIIHDSSPIWPSVNVTGYEKTDLWLQKSKSCFLTVSDRRNYEKSKEFLKCSGDITEHKFNENILQEKQLLNLFLAFSQVRVLHQ